MNFSLCVSCNDIGREQLIIWAVEINWSKKNIPLSGAVVRSGGKQYFVCQVERKGVARSERFLMCQVQ